MNPQTAGQIPDAGSSNRWTRAQRHSADDGLRGSLGGHAQEGHLYEVLRDPVVEVRVELVDDGLVLDDREQAHAEAHHADEQQRQPRQHLRPLPDQGQLLDPPAAGGRRRVSPVIPRGPSAVELSSIL